MSGKKVLFPLLTWMFLTVLVGFLTWYTLISWNPSVNDLNFLAKHTCLVKYHPIHSNSMNGFVGGFYYLKFHPVMKGSYHWGVLLIFQPSNSFFKKGRWFLGVLCCLWVKQRRYFLLSNPGFRWFLFNTMFFSMFTGWKLPESIRCSPGVVQFVIVFKLFYHGKITIIPT